MGRDFAFFGCFTYIFPPPLISSPSQGEGEDLRKTLPHLSPRRSQREGEDLRRILPKGEREDLRRISFI